jgi:hypothetical protein
MWDVTARGLLSIKLHALERVLAQRREILSALQPVPPLTVAGWAAPDPTILSTTELAAGSVQALGISLFGVGTGNELASSGAGWSLRQSPVATEVLARHAHDHNRRHLRVTVLEARGLHPRRGVVVALSANELPNPVVTLSLPDYPPYTTPVIKHTLTPRWPGDHRHSFVGVDPAQSALTVQLGDARWTHMGLTRGNYPLGEAVVHCSHIKVGWQGIGWGGR